MPLNFNKSTSNNSNSISNSIQKKVIGNVRRAQLITTFGPGAICSLKDSTVVMGAIDYWSDYSPVIYENNLQRLLHVNRFKQPKVPLGNNFAHKKEGDIYSIKFPYFYFCPSCGELKQYWKFDKGKCTNPKCDKKTVIPSRFVAACINGHLEDFPYNWWVHVNENDKREKCTNPKLRISFKDTTGGLDSIIISCECGAVRSMAGCMNKDSLQGLKCPGNRPWGGNKAKDTIINCNAHLRCLQRGASNVYFPVTVSALTVPPLSDNLSALISENEEKINRIFTRRTNENEIKEDLEILFDPSIYNIDEVYKKILHIQASKNDTNFTTQKMYAEEYNVFCSGEELDELHIKTHTEPVSPLLSNHIDRIVLVKRLREVLALKGFKRITPDKPNPNDDRFFGWDTTFDDCVPLSIDKTNWLPAIELLGEGIFIRINENKLKEWEKRIGNRYSLMEKQLKKFNIGCENFSSRYVLLHTLSHLLIRQLTFECGYSSAALKERIYSTYENGEPMSGILIYTSTSDSDGSLGGLVRQGRTENLEKLFRLMLQEASWCSSDPVCFQSKGQGYNALNYAACHACSLISETSCIMRNTLLDRCSIVGELGDKEKGLFGDLIDTIMESSINTSSSSNYSNDYTDEVNIEVIPDFKVSHNMCDDDYSDIWDQLIDLADTQEEENAIKELKRYSNRFNKKEKPYLDCLCNVKYNNQSGNTTVTMLWKKSKVMFFFKDNPDYEFFKMSDWKCLSIMDSNLSVDSVLDLLLDED